MNQGLSYDDVLLVPRYSEILSRKDPFIFTKVSTNVNLKIPFLAANMDTVCEEKMAIKMAYLGGLGVLHRFNTIDKQVEMAENVYNEFHGVNKIAGLKHNIAISIGVKGSDIQRVHRTAGIIDLVVIDIAHGDSIMVLQTIEQIKKCYPNLDVMAGNVVTGDACLRLISAGADAIKVGVGPGAACTTREVTGVGYPQFSAVMECAQVSTVPICADGGIRTSGDAAKALAAGASTVMMGSVLAGTSEAPGELIDLQWKQYRGSASKEAQIARQGVSEDSGFANDIVSEGVSGFVKYQGPVSEIIKDYVGGVKSAMSYCGVDNLNDFSTYAEFIKTTHSTVAESSTRLYN